MRGMISDVRENVGGKDQWVEEVEVEVEVEAEVEVEVEIEERK